VEQQVSIKMMVQNNRLAIIAMNTVIVMAMHHLFLTKTNFRKNNRLL
jgi:hypothetical protein